MAQSEILGFTRNSNRYKQHLNRDHPSQEAIRVAAIEEFNHLKRKSVMPSFAIFENWSSELSSHLGRSIEEILDGRLYATDFSSSSVHIQFEGGSDLAFRRAFFVGNDMSAGEIQRRVAVFSERCGYHEFWIGSGDRIESI